MLCKHCGKWFLKNDNKKYCSLECAYLSNERNKKLGRHFFKTKGKTYEEIYGEEKGNWMREIRKGNCINKGRIPSEKTKKLWKIQRCGKGNSMYGVRLYGKLNGNWKGRISFLPYCQKFNKKLKELVRERDNYTCQLCNSIYREGDRKLSVHHIHYDKQNCYPDLITLCVGCNSRVNSKRIYYEELFMNKLNEKSLLFWVRNHDSIL